MNSPAEPNGRPLRYDDAFKLEALRMWKTSRRSAAAVAKELGISAAAIYTWGREARGNGSEASTVATTHLMREMELEIGRLKKENEKLRQQRETLKKTLAIFSESQRTLGEVARR